MNTLNDTINSATSIVVADCGWLDNKKIWNVEDLSDNNMKRLRITFQNGYGISIIRGKFSYGGDEGLYEIAPINRNEDLDGDLLDDADKGDDVLGYLSEERVIYYANKISNLV